MNEFYFPSITLPLSMLGHGLRIKGVSWHESLTHTNALSWCEFWGTGGVVLPCGFHRIMPHRRLDERLCEGDNLVDAGLWERMPLTGHVRGGVAFRIKPQFMNLDPANGRPRPCSAFEPNWYERVAIDLENPEMLSRYRDGLAGNRGGLGIEHDVECAAAMWGLQSPATLEAVVWEDGWRTRTPLPVDPDDAPRNATLGVAR